MSFQCACEFHARAPCAQLPVPVLFRPRELEHSFWLWCMSLNPVLVIAVVRDAAQRPRPRPFRGFFEACTFVCKHYNLPIATDEIVALSKAGWVKARDGAQIPLLESGLRQAVSLPTLPEECGQSALCYGWRSTTHFCMPPNHRAAQKKNKRPKHGSVAPPLSPSHSGCEEVMRKYPVTELGGHEDEVARILATFPTWNAEVIEELLHWGATPRLVAVNHTYRHGEATRAVCTFAQPDGRLVRNVVVPLGVLKLEYPTQTEHLS